MSYENSPDYGGKPPGRSTLIKAAVVIIVVCIAPFVFMWIQALLAR